MIDFKIPSMSCGHCAGVITHTAQVADPNAKVHVDLPTHTVRVDTSQSRESLAAALADAGYAPT
ncbi:MAG: heavy-metal-associated domain-containing protein [Pseudomonadota bacterium]|nr:heavy-metal-associated domain-containing protein [Pseudomonadota bacterium]